jgi:hypothetical protein
MTAAASLGVAEVVNAAFVGPVAGRTELLDGFSVLFTENGMTNWGDAQVAQGIAPISAWLGAAISSRNASNKLDTFWHSLFSWRDHCPPHEGICGRQSRICAYRNLAPASPPTPWWLTNLRSDQHLQMSRSKTSEAWRQVK